MGKLRGVNGIAAYASVACSGGGGHNSGQKEGGVYSRTHQSASRFTNGEGQTGRVQFVTELKELFGLLRRQQAGF